MAIVLLNYPAVPPLNYKLMRLDILHSLLILKRQLKMESLVFLLVNIAHQVQVKKINIKK